MTTAPAPPRWAEYLPVAELQPAPTNAKGHDLGALQASLDAFGAMEPVVLDERTHRLVSGHGRVELLSTLEAAGAKPPEGVVVTGGRWCWLVTRGWRSTDDAHARAAGVALNRVGERGGWDATALNATLDDLWGTPLADAVGWTADELDDLVASAGGLVLDTQPTDAAHAEHVGRADPAPPRSVQGLREVGLMFSADEHRLYLEHLTKLRRVWKLDAAPATVLRALTEAAERA